LDALGEQVDVDIGVLELGQDGLELLQRLGVTGLVGLGAA
jgi:hypothetical protein